MIMGEVLRRVQSPYVGSRRACTLRIRGGGPRSFLALQCFVAFSLYRRSFSLATCVNTSVQPAAIQPRTFTLEAAIFVLKHVMSRMQQLNIIAGWGQYVGVLAIALGPWSIRDAVTSAAILDPQLTVFWRHLCVDAFRRQSTALSER